MTDISSKIKSLMALRGITSSQMARDLSLSPSTISRFFSNRSLISSEKLLIILNYLNLDISKLLAAQISSEASSSKRNDELSCDLKLINALILDTDDIDRKILIKNLKRSTSIN